MFSLSRHTNNSLESHYLSCVLMLSNQVSEDDWEVCLLWEERPLPAKGGCHATDAVATCKPDWQARLQTDVHAAPWSSISWYTATVMNKFACRWQNGYRKAFVVEVFLSFLPLFINVNSICFNCMRPHTFMWRRTKKWLKYWKELLQPPILSFLIVSKNNYKVRCLCMHVWCHVHMSVCACVNLLEALTVELLKLVCLAKGSNYGCRT